MKNYEEIDVVEEIEEEVVPNSPEKEKVEKVVTTVVKKRKRGLMERTVLAIMGPDGLPKVGKKVNQEIIIPTLKTMFVDSATTMLQNMVWKNQTPPSQGGNYYQQGSGNPYSSINTNRTTYNQTYSQNVEPTIVPKISPNGTVQEYLISTRNEAVGVLDTLNRQIISYGFCTVADYYDAIGVDGDFTANSFGWRNLQAANIIPMQGQFVIKLPHVVPIK